MAKEIDRLADVLSGLAIASRSTSVADEIEGLRLMVMQLSTSVALHAVQIARLREAVLLMGGRGGE